MRLTFRLLLKLLFQHPSRRKSTERHLSVIRFRVTWGDCVWKLMSNDRYHAIMDIGRLDLLFRCVRLRDILTNRVRPFVHTVDIQFRRPLPCFRTFYLVTKLCGWDDQYVWLEHFFVLDQEVVVTAVSKNGLRTPAGIIPPSHIITDLTADLNPCAYFKAAESPVNGMHNFIRRRTRTFAKQLNKVK